MSGQVTIRIPPRRGGRRRRATVGDAVGGRRGSRRPRPRLRSGFPGSPACWPSPTTGGGSSGRVQSATRPTSRGSSGCRGRG